MNDREDLNLTAEQVRAQEAVQELSEHPASAEYRGRLKHMLMTGTIETGGELKPLDIPEPAPVPTPAPPPPPPVRGVEPPSAPVHDGHAPTDGYAAYNRQAVFESSKTITPWWKIAARAVYVPAAAAILIFAVFTLNRTPGWEVVGQVGDGIVLVDGREVSITDSQQLADLLKPGTRLQMPADGELQIVSKRNLMVELTPGTDATLPAVPGRWFGREVHSDVLAGEARFVTGPRFAGARFRVHTPEAAIEVRGTTFAVIRDSTATCVCVYEGTVMMGPAFEYLEVVPEGKRRFFYADRRPRRTLDIGPLETMKLSMLQDRSRSSLDMPVIPNPLRRKPTP